MTTGENGVAAHWRAVATPRRVVKQELELLAKRCVESDAYELQATDATDDGGSGCGVSSSSQSAVRVRAKREIPANARVFRWSREEFSQSGAGVARVRAKWLIDGGAKRCVVEECGRRFWMSKNGEEVTVPTSRTGWLTHGCAQYCARGEGGNVRWTRRNGYETTRTIARGEELVIVDNGEAYARDVVSPGEDARAVELFTWMRDAPAVGLRRTDDGGLGVIALERTPKGTVLNLSLQRGEEIFSPDPPYAEGVHGKVSRAFASLGAPGEDALERTRRRFSFSDKYQIVPRVGAFDDTTTLAVIRHSDEPNVARSEAHGIGFFVTLADVDEGEELTMHHGRDANVEIAPTGGCGAHYEWTIKGCDPPWVRAGAGARARGGIDYSKWDDICSSSESD